jgi:hypothetical protein
MESNQVESPHPQSVTAADGRKLLIFSPLMFEHDSVLRLIIICYGVLLLHVIHHSICEATRLHYKGELA